MKVVDISSRSLKKMPELQISKKVLNTEGKLYIYNHKDKWNLLKELIKLYYVQKDSYLADKIYIITQLLANYEDIEMPELVLPNSLISIDNNILGFSMPFIEDNVNMTLLLNNPKVCLDLKIKYLKEIYQILDKVMNIKKLEGNFFLGDIHESNFILDINDQKIKAIDMDSAYINKSRVGISKYITYNDKLFDNPKYTMDEKGMVIPSRATTNLSFIYMLLNALSGENATHRWSLNEFYGYISFLSKMKVCNELLDVLTNIYTASQNNEFNIEYLDMINTKNNYKLIRAKIPKSSGGYY